MIYNESDIFEEIPGDDENCVMKIPPEIASMINLSIGDTLIVTVENNAIVLKKG